MSDITVQLETLEPAQAIAVEVESGEVHVVVPGPFGTKIYVGASPPEDTTALWLDTSAP